MAARMSTSAFCELARQYAGMRLGHHCGQAESDARSLGGSPTESAGTQASAVRHNTGEGHALQAWDVPSPFRPPRSYADASVGTDDVGVEARRIAIRREARRMTTVQVLAVLDLGIPSAMEVELRPKLGTRSFDVQRDLVSLVCGRSVAALAIRMRWLGVAICTLCACCPMVVMFGLHWATGGLGQFALAYEWPLWLEVWMCVGWWLSVAVGLLWYASLQRELAWMALKQFSTMWIIAMTGVFVAAHVSIHDFGVHHAHWFVLPVHIASGLFFPLVAMADALPPKLRLPVLRFFGPFALGCVGAIALVLRLPTAEDTPGKLVWTVMGTDTVTNLQALTYSATVMTVLLAKGVLRAWVFPDQLAFVQTSVRCAEFAADTPPPHGPPALNGASSMPAPTPSASVAPHPLELSLSSPT
jgi:hypothetical protein